jgi:hypothetical protein
MTQRPDAWQKEIMRAAPQWHSRQVCQGGGTMLWCHLASRCIAMDNPCHFGVYQVWCVQRLPRENSRRSTVSAAAVRSSTSSRAEASTTITGDRVQCGTPLPGERTA